MSNLARGAGAAEIDMYVCICSLDTPYVIQRGPSKKSCWLLSVWGVRGQRVLDRQAIMARSDVRAKST